MNYLITTPQVMERGRREGSSYPAKLAMGREGGEDPVKSRDESGRGGCGREEGRGAASVESNRRGRSKVREYRMLTESELGMTKDKVREGKSQDVRLGRHRGHYWAEAFGLLKASGII